LNALGTLDVEDHVLLTAKSAQCFLDSGYTMWHTFFFFIKKEEARFADLSIGVSVLLLPKID
jgi:hypothetical protein